MVFDPNFGRVVPPNVQLTIGDGWRFRGSGATRHLHQAVDIALPVGTSILAAADGIVAQVAPTDSSDAGIFAAVTHPNGLTSRYLHLSRVLVAPGQQVAKGQEIGKSGNTGLSSGPHLHFDLFASDALLPTIIETVGKPATGFFFKTNFGTAIPAEPWLPADAYANFVVSNARELQIPLHRDRPRVEPLVVVTKDDSARNFLIGTLAVTGLVGLGWLTLRAAKHAATALGRRQQRQQRTRHGRER